MIQYNILNVKLSTLQLNKLTSVIKNDTKVTLNLSSNLIGDFNYKTNFPQKILLTERQASRLHKMFWNNPSPNVKLSKNQQFQ